MSWTASRKKSKPRWYRSMNRRQQVLLYTYISTEADTTTPCDLLLERHSTLQHSRIDIWRLQ